MIAFETVDFACRDGAGELVVDLVEQVGDSDCDRFFQALCLTFYGVVVVEVGVVDEPVPLERDLVEQVERHHVVDVLVAEREAVIGQQVCDGFDAFLTDLALLLDSSERGFVELLEAERGASTHALFAGLLDRLFVQVNLLLETECATDSARGEVEHEGARVAVLSPNAQGAEFDASLVQAFGVVGGQSVEVRVGRPDQRVADAGTDAPGGTGLTVEVLGCVGDEGQVRDDLVHGESPMTSEW